MAFVDGIGDLPAGFGEEYVVVLIAGDETVSLKLFQRDADARFGKSEVVHYVDGSDRAFFIFQ